MWCVFSFHVVVVDVFFFVVLLKKFYSIIKWFTRKSRLTRTYSKRSILICIGLPSNSTPLNPAIAACACSCVSNKTVPHPLDRPVSSWHVDLASTTVPTCWNTCLKSSEVVDHGKFLTTICKPELFSGLISLGGFVAAAPPGLSARTMIDLALHSVSCNALTPASAASLLGEINQRPPFGSPAGLSGNFTSQHRVPDRLAVFNQRLFVGLPRQVPDVASAPFLRFRQVGRSLHRRAARILSRRISAPSVTDYPRERKCSGRLTRGRSSLASRIAPRTRRRTRPGVPSRAVLAALF